MQPGAETQQQQVSMAVPPQPAQYRTQGIGSKRNLPVTVAERFHATSGIEHSTSFEHFTSTSTHGAVHIHIQQEPCTKPHTTMT
jgi:hypothetical protein